MIKDTDALLGAVPAQWMPENQNPNVAYRINEQTGERTPLAGATAEEPKKKRGRPRKDAAVEAPEPEAIVEMPVHEDAPVPLSDEEVALLAEES